MINISKKIDNDKITISLKQKNNRIDVCEFNDFYEWSFYPFNGDNTFIISISDYELYEIFYDLYTKIENGFLFNDDNNYDDGLFNLNTEIKNTFDYQKLFNGEYINYNDGLFNIYKGEDYFKLDFSTNSKHIIFPINENNLFSINYPFILLNQKLFELDSEYHQMNFYDI